MRVDCRREAGARLAALEERRWPAFVCVLMIVSSFSDKSCSLIGDSGGGDLVYEFFKIPTERRVN